MDLRLSILVYLAGALCATPLFADSSVVCDDLFKLSCAPGTYDDGTGVAQKASHEKYFALRTKLADSARAKFRLELQKPENTYFRKIVLSATGLSAAPQCDSAEDTPTPDCLDRMSQGASVAVLRFIEAPPPALTQEERDGLRFKDEYYLFNSDQFEAVKKDLLDDVENSMPSDSMAQKIDTEIYPKVRELLLAKVSSLVSDPVVRKKLTDKISAIRFKGQDCSSGEKSKDSVASVLLANASYNPLSNSFRYCKGLTADNSSEFAIASVVAHELSHSIDPCGITLGPSDFNFQYKPHISKQEAEAQFPIGKVITCLRGANSVGASVDQKQGEDAQQQADANISSGAAPRAYDISPQFTSFCEKDQIGESFADWMAAEITPEYIENFEKVHRKLTVAQMRMGYSNAYRFMCRDDESTKFDVHPKAERRANAIGLVQPRIRAQMGCTGNPKQFVYCPPEGFQRRRIPSGAGTVDDDFEPVYTGPDHPSRPDVDRIPARPEGDKIPAKQNDSGAER